MTNSSSARTLSLWRVISAMASSMVRLAFLLGDREVGDGGRYSSDGMVVSRPLESVECYEMKAEVRARSTVRAGA